MVVTCKGEAKLQLRLHDKQILKPLISPALHKLLACRTLAVNVTSGPAIMLLLVDVMQLVLCRQL